MPDFRPLCDELVRLDESTVVVGTSFDHAEKIFRSDDCEKKGLQVPVQGGEEDVTAGFHQLRARPDHAFRVWYML